VIEDIEFSGARAVSDASSHAIYNSLKDRIIGGGLRPGTRLPTERVLAERFNAARNTVRKTMNRLVSEGLVIRHVGRGTFVAECAAANGTGAPIEAPQSYPLSELLEARLLFEPQLAALAAERATDAELLSLTSHLEALRSAQSWIDFKEAKYALHMSIARASKNRFLEHMFEQIVASRRKDGWVRPGSHIIPFAMLREAAVRDNAAVVEALQARNGELARQLICEYLQRTLMSNSGD
jgi:DNA-binding FadR family transcriptional regulator